MIFSITITGEIVHEQCAIQAISGSLDEKIAFFPVKSPFSAMMHYIFIDNYLSDAQ